METHENGVRWVEMTAVFTLVGVFVTLITSHASTGQLEVQQAMECVARSVQRAQLHAVERNAFTVVTFDPALQRIVVAHLSDAMDLDGGTPVTMHDFTRGALGRVSFRLVDDVATPAGLLFDPDGVGLGILAGGRFVDAGEVRLVFAHDREGASGELRITRHAAVEVAGP